MPVVFVLSTSLMFALLPPFETVAVPEKQTAIGMVAPTPYDPGDTLNGITVRTSTGTAWAGETAPTTVNNETASDNPTRRESRVLQSKPNLAYPRLIREPLTNEKCTLLSNGNQGGPKVSVRVA